MKRAKRIIAVATLVVMMVATSLTAYAYTSRRPCGHTGENYSMIGTSLGWCPGGCSSFSYLAKCSKCGSNFGVCQSGHEQ